MMLKEFLRPSKEKIILTILLLLIFPGCYWNGILCERCDMEPCFCPNTDCGPALIGWYITWGNSFSGNSVTIGWNNVAMDVLGQIITGLLIVGLPISYLLSCLIIFIYNKYRGKKK
jgi:hypothetical protein